MYSMKRTGRYSLLTTALLAVCLVWVQSSSAQQVNPSHYGTKIGTDVARSGEAADRVKEAPGQEFVIGAEDVLTISVWREPELSRDVVVRSDGKVSMPLIGEVQAAERTTAAVEQEIATRLHDYIASPAVTVILREVRSRVFNILGEVARPGSYSLARPTSVVDAIAQAGGLREWARVKSIYILRREASGVTRRLPFNYKDALRGKGGDFDLRSRDTVVVP